MLTRRRFAQLGTAALAAPVAPWVHAQSTKEIRIALIAGKTGPFEAYARDDETGLRMGFEYLTGGTMAIDGRPIKLIVKDDQLKPDLSKALLAEAYEDDKCDLAIGPGGSSGAIAALPIAEEYKKILMIEPSAADSITGEKWNRYVFRTARTSTLDASAQVATAKGPLTVAFLAQENVYGRDSVKAYKEAFERQNKDAKLGPEEYVPQGTTDFTAPFQRIADRLKGAAGRKMLIVHWGGEHPLMKIAALSPERYGIELSPNASLLPAMQGWRDLEGLQGGIYYYHAFPKNKLNDWLVAEHRKRFKGMPPDFFICGGFNVACAIVAGIRKAKSTETEKLITALEGLDFETPKGPMHIRKEDHQALMPMFQYRMKPRAKQADEWDLFDLVREIPANEMTLPIRNNRA